MQLEAIKHYVVDYKAYNIFLSVHSIYLGPTNVNRIHASLA